MENTLKLIYNCPLINYLIIKPIQSIKNMFSSITFLCLKRPSELNEIVKTKEKGSDDELKVMVLKKRKLSYSDLNSTFKEDIEESEKQIEESKESLKNNKPRFNSKIMFNIDDRTLFIKNSKSKAELNEKIQLFEEALYIKCKFCGKEVNNADIYCIYDNYYCSERCRHLMYKK